MNNLNPFAHLTSHYSPKNFMGLHYYAECYLKFLSFSLSFPHFTLGNAVVSVPCYMLMMIVFQYILSINLCGGSHMPFCSFQFLRSVIIRSRRVSSRLDPLTHWHNLRHHHYCTTIIIIIIVMIQMI